jgi:hypothetical protein
MTDDQLQTNFASDAAPIRTGQLSGEPGHQPDPTDDSADEVTSHPDLVWDADDIFATNDEHMIDPPIRPPPSCPTDLDFNDYSLGTAEFDHTGVNASTFDQLFGRPVLRDLDDRPVLRASL